MKNLFTILFSISCFLTYATDLYVLPGGSSPNFSSINSAINAAQEGDRILVSQAVYNGNISISGLVGFSLVPLVDGGSYTVGGDISIGLATTNNTNINIAGLILQGNLSGTTTGYSVTKITVLNFINCIFTGSFSPNSRILTNLYYSEFKQVVTGMFKEVIGNNFYNLSCVTSSSNNFYITSSEYASVINTLFNADTKTKIYGNYFEARQLSITASSAVATNQEVDIANNFFDSGSESFNACSNTSSYYNMISFPSSYLNTLNALIENNTFRTYYPFTSGWCVSFPYLSSIVNFRNNLVYSGNWSNSYEPFTLNGIVTVTNNMFNYTAWSPTITFSNATTATHYFSTNPAGGSISSADNFFNTDLWTTTEIQEFSGIVTKASAINSGLDIMECRDIDNTRNNIGTWGGPHSWDNYHSTGTGKGRIIDIQMPSTIYGLPGVTFQVKSKAIRKN